jgi:putative phage-type endonuclease
MKLNDLPKLVDIIDTFDKIVDDLDEYCSENEQLELIEHIMIDLDSYLEQNIESYMSPKFKDMFNTALDGIVDDVLTENDGIDKEHYCYEQLFETLINKTKQIYFSIRPRRSHKSNALLIRQTTNHKEKLSQQLNKIAEIDKSLPEQRTEKWYQMRYNLLSASSIWKALDSDCNVNAIIYEKCKPLNTDKYKSVNVNSPFHWGQKYEPVSQMYYEFKYNAIITEYGCIPHQKYDFLGASPDGINTKRESSRYGRMLEIKNIVNRDITGIPKKEYWVQTQLQMECCDLDECDFLECRFKEYADEEDFNADGSFQQTKDGKYKGIIIQFWSDDKPYYEYAPFNATQEVYNTWHSEIMEKNKKLSWIKNIYWRLDEISCVLIERNREWFQHVLPKFQEVWNTIVKERVSGYEHRKPQKRGEKSNKSKTVNVTKINTGVCNIFLNTDDLKTVTNTDTSNSNSDTNSNKNVNEITNANPTKSIKSCKLSDIIIKINTD